MSVASSASVSSFRNLQRKTAISTTQGRKRGRTYVEHGLVLGTRQHDLLVDPNAETELSDRVRRLPSNVVRDRLDAPPVLDELGARKVGYANDGDAEESRSGALVRLKDLDEEGLSEGCEVAGRKEVSEKTLPRRVDSREREGFVPKGRRSPLAYRSSCHDVSLKQDLAERVDPNRRRLVSFAKLSSARLDPRRRRRTGRRRPASRSIDAVAGEVVE